MLGEHLDTLLCLELPDEAGVPLPKS